MGGRWMMSARWGLMGAVALLASCGIDPEDRAGGGGVGLFGFSGTWTLTPETGLVAEPCAFVLKDSKGTARCDTRREQRFSEDEVVTDEIALDADVVLTETLITLDATWAFTRVYMWQGEEEFRRACSLTISGRAEREAGRQDAGRFDALAGTWTGSARYVVDCEGDAEGVVETVDLRFSADIFGDSAEVGWRDVGQQFEQRVAVQHIDGFGARIAGTTVPEGEP